MIAACSLSNRYVLHQWTTAFWFELKKRLCSGVNHNLEFTSKTPTTWRYVSGCINLQTFPAFSVLVLCLYILSWTINPSHFCWSWGLKNGLFRTTPGEKWSEKIIAWYLIFFTEAVEPYCLFLDIFSPWEQIIDENTLNDCTFLEVYRVLMFLRWTCLCVDG